VEESAGTSDVVVDDEITEDIELSGDQIEELQSTENYIMNKMNEPKPFSSHSTLPTSFN
tara:strand:- start:9873 stop:10049 length:177 start_codon:yes stop_codon:yes gene_type:complete